MLKYKLSGKSLQRGAISARSAFWQSSVLAAAILLFGSVKTASGGTIDTMPIGDYQCELPGDAAGPVGIRMGSEDFTIVTASSYRANGSLGSYLLTGETLTMTSGAHNGKRYRRISDSFVRMINADGQDGTIRCVRQNRNNS